MQGNVVDKWSIDNSSNIRALEALPWHALITYHNIDSFTVLLYQI